VNTLLGICLMYLRIEENAERSGHHKVAEHAKKQRERYRARLEAMT